MQGVYFHTAGDPTDVMPPGEKPPSVPKVLCDLFSSGARYEKVPQFTWNLQSTERRARLRKELSVVFSIDTVVTSQDIIYGFDAAGIDIDEIASIQRKASNNMWVVSFRTTDAKNAALGVPSVTIASCTVFLGDCENRIQIVKIYESPMEMPDTALIGRLSHYGKVFSFRRDRIADGIYNGVRTARMRLNLPIPPTIFVANELIRIWYPTQPKLCRRCGDPGHVAAKCSSVRCFNCEVSGHRIEDCDRPPLCSICLAEGHAGLDCPFLLYSANIITQPGESTYADVVKTISEPVASPSYASVASCSPEQTVAIKAAQAAGASSQQPPASSRKPVQKSRPAPKQKAASEPPTLKHQEKLPDQKSQEKKPKEKSSSESKSKHDRGVDRERDRKRERDEGRGYRHSCDFSRERDRDRSSRRGHHHHRQSESSGEDSDCEFVEVRRKRHSRR